MVVIYRPFMVYYLQSNDFCGQARPGQEAGCAAMLCLEGSYLSIEILLLISKYTIKKQEEMDGK